MFQNYLDRYRMNREECHGKTSVRERFMCGLIGEVKLFPRRSFTLIELLVVIAMIGILTSIFMPSLSKSREKIKSSVCKSNLKQIGVATVLWTDNNDGWTASRNWSHPGDNNAGTLKPYTETDRKVTHNTFSGLYHCPSLTRARLAGTASQNYRYTSYAVNGSSLFLSQNQEHIDLAWLRGANQLSAVVNPVRKVYFAEKGNNAIYANAFTYTVNQSPTRWHAPFTGVYGKTNVLWFDGHVSIELADLVRRADFWDYYFNPLSE